MLVSCPQCRSPHEIGRAGRYRCPNCDARFQVPEAAFAAPSEEPSPGLVAAQEPPGGTAEVPAAEPRPRPDPPSAPASAPAGPAPQAGSEGSVGEATGGQQAALSPGVVQGLRELDAALRADPRNRVHYFKLAQAYADAGLKDRAVEVLRAYLQVEPGNEYAQQRIAALSRSDRVKRGAPGEGRPLPIPVFAPKVEDPARVARRRKRLLTAAGVVLVLVLAVVVKVLVFPSTWPVAAGQDDAWRPRWSPDGESIAYLSDRGLHVFDLAEGESRLLVEREEDYVRDHAWSPDGRRLAFVASVREDGIWDRGVHVVELSSGEVSLVALGAEPGWGADSMSLALQASGQTLEEARRGIRDARPGLHLTDTFTHDMQLLVPGEASEPRLSSSGSWVVFWRHAEYEDGDWEEGSWSDPAEFAETVLEGGADSMGSASRALDNEAAARMREAGGGEVQGPEWWPRANLYAVSTSGGDEIALTSDGLSCSPRWDRRAERIHFLRPSEEDPEAAAMWSVRPDGSGLERITAKPFRTVDPETVRLTPDGRKLVYERSVEDADVMAEVIARTAGTDIHLRKISGGKARRLGNRHAFKKSFVLSPDGDRLAYEVLNPDTERREIWVLEL